MRPLQMAPQLHREIQKHVLHTVHLTNIFICRLGKVTGNSHWEMVNFCTTLNGEVRAVP